MDELVPSLQTLLSRGCLKQFSSESKEESFDFTHLSHPPVVVEVHVGLQRLSRERGQFYEVLRNEA